MGSEAKASYGAQGRFDGLWFDPEDLTIANNTEHELFDERIARPVDEDLVRSVMRFGVLQPVLVTKQSAGKGEKPVVLVVTGRQRVRAACEANKRLVAAGKEPVKVPAVPARTDDFLGVMITENELRSDDAPMVKARKLQRYLALGRTEEEAAIAFGVSRESLRQWKLLVELHPKVQKAVDRRELPAHVATKMHGIAYDAQPEALEKMRAEGALRGRAGEERARDASGKKPAGATRLALRITPTEVRTLRRTLESATGLESLAPKVRKALDEILGRLAALETRARGGPKAA